MTQQLERIEEAIKIMATNANIMDFTAAGNRNNNVRRDRNGEELPKSQLWLNFGYVAQNGSFIALPSGVAVDTMREADTRGQNEEFVKKSLASNALEVKLVVRMRRVKDALSIPQGENEYVADLKKMLFAAE
jgi:hypothetical protein